MSAKLDGDRFELMASTRNVLINAHQKNKNQDLNKMMTNKKV